MDMERIKYNTFHMYDFLDIDFRLYLRGFLSIIHMNHPKSRIFGIEKMNIIYMKKWIDYILPFSRNWIMHIPKPEMEKELRFVKSRIRESGRGDDMVVVISGCMVALLLGLKILIRSS
jgi:hypothetical protein